MRYSTSDMKAGIHPQLFTTKVHCNGCNTEFETRSTVESITVEICSNCHPFYTGKQKLVDTAGRVEKFQARRKAAESAKLTANDRATQKAEREAAQALKNDPELTEIAAELKEETVAIPEIEKTSEKTPAETLENSEKSDQSGE